MVINNNGTVLKSFVTIVPTRPDIFAKDSLVGPGGRSMAFNATNTVTTTEPFAIKTVRRRGDLLVPSVIRLYLTGVQDVTSTIVQVRLRDTATGNAVIRSDAVLVEPGIYTIDFEIPTTLFRAGDVPVIITVNAGGTVFESRLDDTATRFNIL
jgi:hypothetical protein